jgi:hypothetical protein
MDDSTKAAVQRRGIRQSWWWSPLLIAVASRAWGTILVFGLGRSALHLFVDPPAAGPATLWDGAWFLEIARFGYHAEPVTQGLGVGYYDFAFWPAWPVVLGVFLRLIPISPDLVAWLLASSLSILAVVLWARVLERAFDRSVALPAIALVAFSPSAFVLSMGYSEPLYLVLGALFFLSAGRSVYRPVIAALAQATRLTGVALGAAALPDLWRTRGRDPVVWLTLIGPVIVFAIWWVAIATLTGDPLGYLKGSPSWLAGSGASNGPISFLRTLELGGIWLLPMAISGLFAALIFSGIFVLVRTRRFEFAWYSLAAAVPSLVLASWEWMPRHLLVAVPAAAALISVLRPRRRRQLVILAIGTETVYALFVLGGRFAP